MHKKLKLSQVKEFYKNNYCGKNLIVAVAGDVDHEQVVSSQTYCNPGTDPS